MERTLHDAIPAGPSGRSNHEVLADASQQHEHGIQQTHRIRPVTPPMQNAGPASAGLWPLCIAICISRLRTERLITDLQGSRYALGHGH